MPGALRKKTPGPALPMASDVAVSSRTILELTATVMDAAFNTVGEGVILGTMPSYLERFGAKNAQYLRKHHVDCDAASGATASLTPLNFLSRVTGTPFALPEASKDLAVKRLLACEFAPAFEGKAPFAKAMICLLHKAAYQGSVNGLLQDPRRDGYDVTLRSRILFGDDHCDFVVESRKPRPHEPDEEGPTRRAPDREETARLAHHFYTAILVGFVDYLSTVLAPAEVAILLEDCAAAVGRKAHRLLLAGAPGGSAANPQEVVRSLLAVGGRTVEADPAPDGGLRVTACPYARPILSGTKAHDEATARLVRENACRLCHGFLAAAADAQSPGTTVGRDRCLTLGDAECRFQVDGGARA